ncbi:condensation domain-containing protein [Nocardia sp. NPDC057668]|uniref:condensation domain-containing protein n=1 Tax=Nocardia sp. NPDC057668 TaxID=3346202 RepID=UPI00366C0B07
MSDTVSSSADFAARDGDIAVVGIGARFPGAADLAEFRANLRAGHDAVGPMPAERIAATGLDPAAGYLPMGHLTEIEQFDHRFFNLSRREASVIDPQQRIALSLAQRAVEDAGYPIAHLAASDTAVVLSASQSSYHAFAVDPGPLSLLGNAGFAGAARIAHLLGLTGPCYSVDSGCNSALVAVHRACRELSGGDADYALAGGVSVRVPGTPSWGGGVFTEILSPGGRCRAFDADADGTVGGEGGAVLLLTTVARARADRAPIHAVIRGSATLHNGHAAATISTPSATAQARVIAKAWRSAGASTAAAGYLETHGSGTRLGDAIELEGITAAFGDHPLLPIGSVKTNIGHLDHASGIAGLVKAVLGVAHAELYPSLHFSRPTGDIDLAAARIEVLTAARPWPGDAPRIAGVSSFSLGGSIAHCVVAQPPAEPARPDRGADRPRLVGISARTPRALAALTADLTTALSAPEPPALDDIAFTLGVGRAHYAHRYAVTASSTADLVRRLRALPPADRTAATRPPRVVLLLSPDAQPIPVDSGAALPAQLPATGATAAVLAGQCAIHDRLRDCGIEFAAILSAGSSRFVSRYLLGSRAEVTAAEIEGAAATVDIERLAHAARTLTTQGPVVFLEPARGGRLGQLLAAELPEAEIIGPADDSAGLPGLLGQLYTAGVDLDWGAFAPADARRIRLPGHPQLTSRCWIDIPSHWHTGAQPPADTAAASTSVVASTAAGPDPDRWLRATLGELLGADTDLDGDADYFELGGNSIIAVQLVERIEEAFGFRPKLLDIYERPRLSEFSALLAAGAGRAAVPARAAIPALVAHDEPVMSSGQERMWFHHQFDPGTTLYNYPVVQLLRGGIDIDALHGTFEDLAERHETLRYNFAEQDGTPVLRIRPRLGEFFRRVDVSAAPDPTAAAHELVRAAAQRPFDLANDPLVQVLVITIAPETHVLQLSCHHAVTDGATPTILAREIPELYAARRAGRPHTLAPLPIRYRDYAAWHRELLAGSALDHELAYWTAKLADAPLLHLPTDFPRPARKTFVGDLYPFTIPGALLNDLRGLAQRESVSLFVVLLSALYLTLARHSGQRDIVVGTPTTGRGRREFDDLIGYFNSTVALRADFGGDRELPELLARVRSVVLEALEHQQIPFDRVVNALVERRDLARTPLFDVLYIHQVTPRLKRVDEAATELFDPDHSAGHEYGGLPTGTAKFDLTLVTFEFTDDPDADIGACWEYSTELFTRQTVARVNADFLRILETMAEAAVNAVAPPVLAALIDDPRARTPETQVPTDFPRTGLTSHTLDTVSDTVRPAEVYSESALHDTALAAFAVLLTWYTGADRVAIGLPETVTGQPGTAELDLSGDPTWTGLLERVGAAAQAPAVGGAPAAVSFHGTSTGPVSAEPRTELALSCTRTHPGTVVLRLHYAAELFEHASALAMLADLRRLFEALPARPAAAVLETASAALDSELEVIP